MVALITRTKLYDPPNNNCEPITSLAPTSLEPATNEHAELKHPSTRINEHRGRQRHSDTAIQSWEDYKGDFM